MQHDGSGWHWDSESGGEGIQHLALKTDEQRRSLREELRRLNGDPTHLEIVDSTQVRTCILYDCSISTMDYGFIVDSVH